MEFAFQGRETLDRFNKSLFALRYTLNPVLQRTKIPHSKLKIMLKRFQLYAAMFAILVCRGDEPRLL